MAAIEIQLPGDIPEVSSTGLHIPDGSRLGTGTFTVNVSRGAFASSRPFAPLIANPLVFGICASVNPGVGILVSIHDSDGVRPRHRLGFAIPRDIDTAAPHVLVIEFASWQIVSASIDGVALAPLDAGSGH